MTQSASSSRGPREDDPLHRSALIDRIFKGTAAAFCDNGYELISMDTIARHAGVSRASLYNNFESKEALVRQFLRIESERFVNEVVDPQGSLADPRAELARMARRFLRRSCEPDALGVFRLTIGEGKRFPWIGELFVRHGSGAIIARFEELIGAAGRAPKRAGLLARQLYSLLTGTYFHSRLLGLEKDRAFAHGEEVIRQSLELLGLTPRG